MNDWVYLKKLMLKFIIYLVTMRKTVGGYSGYVTLRLRSLWWSSFLRERFISLGYDAITVLDVAAVTTSLWVWEQL